MRIVVMSILLCLHVVSNADNLPADSKEDTKQQAGQEVSITSADDEIAPDAIHSYGDTYISACTTSELKRIKADVFRFAGTSNPENAWQVVSAMLCREDESSKRFIIKHMPKKIAIVDSSNGDWNERRTDASPDLMIKRRAWGATVYAVEPDHIEVRYYSNEACLSSFPLLFKGKAWMITKIETSCD